MTAILRPACWYPNGVNIFCFGYLSMAYGHLLVRSECKLRSHATRAFQLVRSS